MQKQYLKCSLKPFQGFWLKISKPLIFWSVVSLNLVRPLDSRNTNGLSFRLIIVRMLYQKVLHPISAPPAARNNSEIFVGLQEDAKKYWVWFFLKKRSPNGHGSIFSVTLNIWDLRPSPCSPCSLLQGVSFVLMPGRGWKTRWKTTLV